MRACTTVSRRDLPRARVLADSFARHHPGQRLHVLVTDDIHRTVRAEEEPFDLCRPDELPLAPGEFDRLAAIYDPKELVTAVKFWQTRLLLESDGAVLFLDSDVEVFSELDELAALCVTHGVVVTPHSVEPIPLDGETPTEFQIQRSGVYNTGFIGVGASGSRFLDWVCERAERDFVLDRDAGLWFDQRWFDFVPLYFSAHISRERAYDVAYWNLHERTLREHENRFYVGDDPLVFFHFSGFDPHQGNLLTRVASRIRPEPGSALGRLCGEYAEKLLGHGYDECMEVPYGFARIGPLEWTEERRRAYRQALVAADRGQAPRPPEPGDETFPDWLREVAGSDRRARTKDAFVQRLARRILRKRASDSSPRIS